MSWSSSPICALPGYADCDAGLIDAVLEEAARFAGDVLSPSTRWATGTARAGWPAPTARAKCAPPPASPTPTTQFAEGGWMALPCPPDYGGQGLPRLLAVAVSEMWKSANLSFSHVITSPTAPSRRC
jgi:acyl-CoA dehydrogenase